jgi:hypothetical protein
MIDFSQIISMNLGIKHFLKLTFNNLHSSQLTQH